LAFVARHTVRALGASNWYSAELSRPVWTICISSERARPLLATDLTAVLSVRRETLKPRTMAAWNARTPP
jgi:hypothetical protein